jgi:hypothetical protein
MAPVQISVAEQETLVGFEPSAGVFGMAVFLGGCWSLQGSREEQKKTYREKWNR